MTKTQSTTTKMASAKPRDRRADLREHYGVEFPDEIFVVWELARSMSPRDPRSAFWIEPFNVSLHGPFDVLAGAFDRKKPNLSALLHWRFTFDPPEFFTIACGDVDGLHWGYWFDDAAGAGWVASYYTNDAYELEPCGRTFGEALRRHLESCWAGVKANIDDDPDAADAYRRELEALEKVRARIAPLGTGARPETGEKYMRKYDCSKARRKQTVTPTKDGMGIVAPKKAFEPVSVADEDLDAAIHKAGSRRELIAEAERAIAEGRPAKALKIAKELWVRGTATRPEIEGASYPLLIAAYEALGRPALAEVVRVHAKDRRRPSVDIFEQQS
jgi:hypothetical protein